MQFLTHHTTKTGMKSIVGEY